MTTVVTIVVGILGLGAGYALRKVIGEAKIKSAEEEAKRILSEAQKDAENKRREALLESKEEVHRLRADAEREIRERRQELQQIERRLVQRDETLEKRSDALAAREDRVAKKEREVDGKREHLDQLIAKEKLELERIAGLTTEEAKEVLLARVENEVKHEMAIIIKEAETRAKEEADRKARDILSIAIQRCATDHVAESTVSVVSLPNDEMKGRIIGREGRNIRTLETLTGIDLIIDDTPEAVILSGFDPVRREVARIALEKLVDRKSVV